MGEILRAREALLALPHATKMARGWKICVGLFLGGGGRRRGRGGMEFKYQKAEFHNPPYCSRKMLISTTLLIFTSNALDAYAVMACKNKN